MNKRKSILIGLVLILLSGAVLADNVLKQKVSWSPETLNLSSLKPGESTTTSVILTNASLLANQKINGEHLSFQVTNGAGTNITATANFPKKFEPGQKITVTLVVSVASDTPALPPGVIAGKVQLVKNENEKKLFEKPLLVNIAVSSIPLPPFPDPALNNATLLGIDFDANGVRDDIDWYVVTTYPDSAKIREALKQEARAAGIFMRDREDKAKTWQNYETVESKGFPCLIHSMEATGGNVDDAVRADNKFTVQFLNNKERSRAYHKAYVQMGGYVGIPTRGDTWEADKKSSCTFNPDLLPN